MFALASEAASASSLIFERLGAEDGLPQTSVTAIAQDGDGFIWFGTRSGLGRYDGRQFAHRSEILGRRELESVTISDLLLSRAGTLWVGTQGEGIFYRPSSARRFEAASSYGHGPGASQLARDTIALAETRDGRIWAGTKDGLLQFHPDGRVERYLSALDLGLGRDRPLRVNSLSELPESHLAIGTQAHGLLLLQRVSGKLVRRLPVPGDRPEAPASVRALLFDRQQRLWVGTREDGLYVSPAQAPGGDLVQVAALGRNEIVHLSQDVSGQIWVATRQAGLFLLAEDGRLLHQEAHELGRGTSLPNNFVWAAFHGRDGAHWVGTDKGAARLNPMAERVPYFTQLEVDARGSGRGLSHAMVSGIQQGRDGRVWVSTFGGGINRLDLDSGRFDYFRHSPGDEGSLISDEVDALLEDSRGRLWVGTYSGLSLLPAGSSQFRHFTKESTGGGLVSNAIIAFMEDREGQIWVGTLDSGLSLIDASLQFRPHLRDGSGRSLLPHERVSLLQQDAKGQVWIMNNGGGIHRYADGRLQSLKSLGGPGCADVNPRATSFVELAGGRYLAGTADGLVEFRDLPAGCRIWHTGHGLPSATIYGLAAGDGDDVWISTNAGVSRLDLHTGQFRNFDQRDGLQGGEFNTRAYARLKDGRLAFGGINGLSLFHPSDLLRARATVPPILTAVRVGEALYQRGGPPFERLRAAGGLRIAGERVLERLAIEFASLDFANPHGIAYAYRMDGVDSDWNRADGAARAQYSNLTPGQYVFRLRARSPYGQWVDGEETVAITVAPPLWLSTEAYGVYTFGFLGMAVFVWRENRRRLKSAGALNARLLAADRMKDYFLARTSHELRTPLIGIVGLAEAMCAEAGSRLPESHRTRLMMIASSGKRLANLIGDILDVTRLRYGAITLKHEDVDLHGLVEAVLMLGGGLNRRHHLRLVNAVPEGLPRVHCDEARIEQVLFNLLSNAIKVSTGGSIIVGASWNADEYEIWVSDEGPGVPRLMREEIFREFVQGETGAAPSGVGLGLPISRHLVELHGGHLWCEDNPVGQGARFAFTLPVRPRVADAAPAQGEREDGYPGPLVGEVELPDFQEIPGGPYHVVVADDEPVSRQVLGDFLASQGYAVTLMSDGQRLLDYVHSHADIDLVCVDVVMPGLSGFQVCERIRSRHDIATLPILLMSAVGRTMDIAAGLSAGANDYVVKPVDKTEFLARVASLLGLRQSFRLRRQRDEASELAKASMRLALHHAHTDSLTGLPQRNVVNAYLQEFMAGTDSVCAVLFIDLDRLGKVNASFGHSVGDEILKQASMRLRGFVRDNDHAVRFEGDQFLLAVGSLPPAPQQCYSYLVDIAGRCIAGLAQPYQVGEHSIAISASIGISIYPLVSATCEELIRHANIAMRQAKSRAATHFLFYEASMEAGGRYALELEGRMREALVRGEFELRYQPQIDAGSGELCGVEALIRWRHPDKGLVLPGQFIPLAEESGYIIEIGRWVLERACSDFCRWQAEGIELGKVAVNLSAVQFREDKLVERVAEIISRTGIAPRHLELEITESATMDNLELTHAVLHKLHELGVILSIDDFGTGYSSLSYLKEFPVHALKIDQSFVRDCLKDTESRAIVESIITLAHSLRLHTIAEGVETEKQYGLLAELGCAEAQGYLFSKPLPEPEFRAYARGFMPVLAPAKAKSPGEGTAHPWTHRG